jgi:hypothetical protein
MVERNCSIEGCDQPYESHGWCHKHYMQQYSCGNPLISKAVSTCSVEDCDRPHYARGLCRAHYQRQRKGRSLEAPLQDRAAKGTDVLTRIMNRVVEDDDCWIWTGARFTNGYGEINIAGRPQPVHRMMYEAKIGPIPKGRIVMHSCDRPLCVNPLHLSAGTYRDNSLDMMSKGRGRKQFGHDR